MAVAVLFNALTRKGFRTAIVAPSKRQSLKMVDKISRLLSGLGRDVLEGPPRKGPPRKGRLAFQNGSVIEALPNNPDTIRGETMNMVVLDEFAYIEHDKELYDAHHLRIEHHQRDLLRDKHSRVQRQSLLCHGHGQ